MEKVDVCINVYGKPYQTLLTLKSLLKYNEKWIDKIYIIEECAQPYGDDLSLIKRNFPEAIYYRPNKFFAVNSFGTSQESISNEEHRLSYRYQYGIEKSNKKYLFISHNDVLYTGEIIKEMLLLIEDNSGIGLIGQCWNCPLGKASKCSGEKFNSLNITYEEVREMMKSYGPSRYAFWDYLDKDNVMPLPECRLNEFACIINREHAMKEVENLAIFGSMEVMDTGCGWFKRMVHKGYTFINYDINKASHHGYFSKLESEVRTYSEGNKFFVSGYPTQLNEVFYRRSEELANKYYHENYE